jgi:hypothetical protein
MSGDKVTAWGSGFQAFEPVVVEIQSGAQASLIRGSAEVNNRGAFSASVDLVQSAAVTLAPGLYSVIAKGASGSAASAALEIISADDFQAASAADVSLLVAGGINGIAIGEDKPDIAGAGFASGEDVLIWLVNAGAAGDFLLTGASANGSGAFSVTAASLPDSVSAGNYTVKANGDQGSHATAFIKVVE